MDEYLCVSDEANVLLPLPKPGDKVDFQYRGQLQTLRLPTGSEEPLHACLAACRPGETRMLAGSPLQLLRLRPRHWLGDGAHLEVHELSLDRRRPQAGSVAFFDENGCAQRRQLQEGALGGLLDQALQRLHVGEAATMHVDGDSRSLRLLHVAHYEDVSLFGDSSARKLSLRDGGYDAPSLLGAVTALVDGKERSWKWGRGEVDLPLELAVRKMSNGECAEVHEEDRCRQVELTHVAQAHCEEPLEEATNALARRLYAEGKLELAWWHFCSVGRLLTARCAAGDPAARELGARAAGALSVVSLRLGQPQLALAASRRARQWAQRPVDLLRGARAALACAELLEARALLHRLVSCQLTEEQREQAQALRRQLKQESSADEAEARRFWQRAWCG